EIADLDGDDALDVVGLVERARKPKVFVNDGSGGFSKSKNVPSPPSAVGTGVGLVDLAVGDFDGSGGMDVVGLFQGNHAVVYTGLGSGSTSATHVALDPQNDGAKFEFVSAGSLEKGDGGDDFAVASKRREPDDGLPIQPEVLVYENTDSGWTKYYSAKSNSSVSDLMMADVTFDGRADLLVGSTFWRHSFQQRKTYEQCNGSCRTQLGWSKVDKTIDGFTRARVTDDAAPELVVMHDHFEFTVLKPSCEE
ncbi:MAG: FG-GAP-like repeat-containing protein, partial [Bradymonadaceae bacterium]